MDGGGWDTLRQSTSDKRPIGQPTQARDIWPRSWFTCSSFHKRQTPAGSDLLPPSVGHWSRSEGLPEKNPAHQFLRMLATLSEYSPIRATPVLRPTRPTEIVLRLLLSPLCR